MSRFARLLRGIAIVLAAFVLLAAVAIGAAALLVDFDALIAKYRDQAVASASDALGREVRVDEVDPSLFPTFGLVARGIRIAGPEGRSRDSMLRIEAVRIDVSLLRVLTSLGKEIQVDGIALAKPRLSVSRDQQGRMSFADIQARLSRKGAGGPPNPKAERIVQGARVRVISVEDGAVSFVDQAAPEGKGRLYATGIDGAIRGVALGEPAQISLKMALLSEKRNVDLKAETAPLPESLERMGPPSIRVAHLEMDSVPLRALSAWIPGNLDGARLSSSLSMTGAADRIEGTASVGGLSIDRGEPLEIRAETALHRTGDALEIDELDVALGDAALRATGRIDLPGDRNPGELDVSFSTDRIDLTALGSLLPGITISAEPAALEVAGRLKGPATASGATLDVQRAEIVIGETEIQGTAEVRGVTSPRIRFALTSPYLDLDELRDAIETEQKEPRAGEPTAQKKEASSLLATGTLAAPAGRVAGQRFENLDGRIRLQDGRLLVESLSLDTLGGRIALGGSSLNLTAEPAAYTIRANLRGLDVGRLLQGSAKLALPLTGGLDASIDLTGRGGAWAEVSRSLQGRFDGKVRAGRIEGINLAAAVIGPLASALPFVAGVSGVEIPTGDVTEYQTIEGSFRVGAGDITLAQPLRIATNLGVVVLGGRIGLDERLDLTGAYELSPETVSALTGGKVRPPEAVPIGLKVGCNVKEPCIQGVDVEAAVVKLVEMYAGEATKEATKGLEEEAKKRLKETLGF